MKKILIKFIYAFYLFFIINLNVIDSNSNKILYYDKSDMYDKGVYKIYFKNMNTSNISILSKLDIQILSYIIDDKEYYVRNIDKLKKSYTKNMTLEDKIYYYINGIKIDGVKVFCEVKDLIEISNLVDIY